MFNTWITPKTSNSVPTTKPVVNDNKYCCTIRFSLLSVITNSPPDLITYLSPSTCVTHNVQLGVQRDNMFHKFVFVTVTLYLSRRSCTMFFMITLALLGCTFTLPLASRSVNAILRSSRDTRFQVVPFFVCDARYTLCSYPAHRWDNGDVNGLLHSGSSRHFTVPAAIALIGLVAGWSW